MPRRLARYLWGYDLMLSEHEILTILATELSQSAGGNANDQIESQRQDAMSYYLGGPTGTEVRGRSAVVSTDVADAIEWIMPEVMEQLTKNNEVVVFDPQFDGDEDQAELETQFVFDTVMKDNNGFVILHQAVKDALLQKAGVIKTFFEDIECVDVHRYTGLNQQAFDVLVGASDVELMEQDSYVDQEAMAAMQQQYQQVVMQAQQAGQPPPPEPEPPMLYDVKISITEQKRKISICSVPPEEFRISRQHSSPDPTTARFTAHVVLKTASDLIKSGIPKSIVDELPRGDSDSDRDYRFNMMGETTSPFRDVSDDESQNLIEVAECYLHIDVDGDGISEFMKIEVAGGDNPTHILRMEEMSVEDHPFGAFIAIMMSHKFFGLSIYDRLKQIQDQKTTLVRNILDNIYLNNNQRTAVLEGQVNLDDLMISRPGGIVRQRVPGAIEPIITPQLGTDAYQMLDYLDQVRAGRVGVTPEGQVQVDNIGDRVGSEGIERLMTAKEAVVGLMIRVIAETGVKPLMVKVRNLLRKHSDAVYDYKFRDRWIQVDPTQWNRRDRTTVRVGTGSGNNRQQVDAIMAVMQDQGVIMQEPGQTLVTAQHRFNARRTFCNVSGLNGASPFYLDPSSQQGITAAEQMQQLSQEDKQKKEEERIAALQMQEKISNAEMGKAQAQLENVRLKSQIEQLQLKLDEAEAEVNAQEAFARVQFDYAKLRTDAALKLTEIETKQKTELNKQYVQNKESTSSE